MSTAIPVARITGTIGAPKNIGGRVQLHHGSALHESANFGGVGFELGKNWIIGRRTLVGLGVGATRLFGGSLAGESLTLPTFRIANVGITF